MGHDLGMGSFIYVGVVQICFVKICFVSSVQAITISDAIKGLLQWQAVRELINTVIWIRDGRRVE